MKVEIWSDVVCPFCYIGKRKFETALAQFADKADIEIVWKSYQLQPDAPESINQTTYELLAEKYGMSVELSMQRHHMVTQQAKEVGLDYRFDIAKPANTLKAHQLTKLAQTTGKQDDAEEALFKAYFTEGKNINDVTTLAEIGVEIGLEKSKVIDALEKQTFVNDVRTDIYEAQQVGVRGVPFFVFNRKYAVSGAQQPETFLGALQQSFMEWKQDNAPVKLNVTEGESCTPDGECA